MIFTQFKFKKKYLEVQNISKATKKLLKTNVLVFSHEYYMIDQRKLMFYKKNIACELDFQPNDRV